jgi:hypothetical protein
MANVVLADPDSGGLDAMLGGLLMAAGSDPAKVRVLAAARGTVTIAVPDAEVEVGLRFGNGVVTVYPHAIPGSKIRIELPSETLLGLSSIPLLWGLPSVRTPEGRAFTKQLLRREVRITGLWHLGLLRQVTTLLSVA